MCLANNRYQAPRIRFDDTILAGLRVKNPTTRRIEHVIAYFNRPQLDHGLPEGWEPVPSRDSDDFPRHVRRGSRGIGRRISATPVKTSRGNAMLITVPIKKGSKFGPENLIAVKDFAHFMEDYKTAVAPPVIAKGITRRRASMGADSLERGPIVVKGFDGGLYDVVMSLKASDIPSVIAQVDESKRPDVNAELYKETDTVNDGKVAYVLFCFDEADAGQAGCVAIRYTPADAKTIYLPGLDGHNGKIERGQVKLNHTLVFGTFDMSEGVGSKVHFQDFYDDGSSGFARATYRVQRPYWMLDRVIGAVLSPNMLAPQGDFSASVADVKKGVFKVARVVPSGWANLPDKPAHPSPNPFYISN